MKWEMEILSPVPYTSFSSCLFEEKSKWTTAENKAFENALAVFDKDSPDRWHRVAEMVPGKSVEDVMRHYKELEDDVSSIEAGLVPLPGYAATSPFTLEWGVGHDFDGFKQSCYGATGKRCSSTRLSEQERKKGVPWTEEEHKLFLMGLKKYGKGDWRNISRNYVITRTPTQVASHAQKYFIRQLSGGKDKRRASIHDITTISLNDNRMPSPDTKKATSPEYSTAQQPNSTALHKMPFMWNHGQEGMIMNFNANDYGSAFLYSLGGKSCDVNLQGQNMQTGAVHESYLRNQGTVFQMQAAYQHPAA